MRRLHNATCPAVSTITTDAACVCGAESAPATKPTVYVLRYDEAWHDGEGWYYLEEEYPEEGSVGAFTFRQDAIAHLAESGEPFVIADYSDKATAPTLVRLRTEDT